MRTGKTGLIFAILAVLVTAGIGTSAALPPPDPVYSMEGAWYGIVSMVGMAPTQSLDTFTSNAQRQGVEGTFLCTIPAVGKMPNYLSSNPTADWLSQTASGHGNWVRIGKNTFAFTAVRSIVHQDGTIFGWAWFWGTITPISDDEYTGTMNAQYLREDGMNLFGKTFTGTLHSRRIEVQQ